MALLTDALVHRDLDTVESLLADEVVFRSPVAFEAYPGKAITLAILSSVTEVLEGLRYETSYEAPDAAAYVFRAQLDGLEIHGCDFVQFDDDGRVTEFAVMVRPLRAAQALAARMGERYPAIQAAATQWRPQP